MGPSTSFPKFKCDANTTRTGQHRRKGSARSKGRVTMGDLAVLQAVETASGGGGEALVAVVRAHVAPLLDNAAKPRFGFTYLSSARSLLRTADTALSPPQLLERRG